jgi:hypothetical protein
MRAILLNNMHFHKMALTEYNYICLYICNIFLLGNKEIRHQSTKVHRRVHFNPFQNPGLPSSNILIEVIAMYLCLFSMWPR